MSKNPTTYDYACYRILMQESREEQKPEIEKKIRRKLKYNDLGPFDPVRIERLRRMRDSLQKDIGSFARSPYFLGSKGNFAAFEDYDLDRMEADYRLAFPEISEEDMKRILSISMLMMYLK